MAGQSLTFFGLVARGLRWHWRAQAGALVGAAVACATLTGALLVGDSVRESLRAMALARLGEVEFALEGQDRFFRAALARDIQSRTSVPTAPVLALPGTASNPEGTARANRVQILGVDESFWKLAPVFVRGATPQPGEVWLGETLARQMNITTPGATVVLRMAKPSALSREAVLTPKSDVDMALRVRVQAILGDEAFGRFSLRASQVPALNAYVHLGELQQLARMTNRANLLLAGGHTQRASARPLDLEAWQLVLARAWTLADADVHWREANLGRALDLVTPRIFLDPPVVQAALAAAPQAQPVLTYLVNLLQSGERSTPYSMVAAVRQAPGMALQGDEISVNAWLAKDLAVDAGAKLTLTYYLADSGSSLRETSRVFRVQGVWPMDGPYADRTLMPEFPGIAQAESTHEWDAGFPLVHKIRPEDDAYWKQYRGTPKALVSFDTARELWGNRYGEVTAVRFPLLPGVDAAGQKADWETRLKARLAPEALNLRFAAVRQSALQAVSEAQDFGGLFLGFSFFLIGAALILVALLFRFGVEQRAAEAGALLAMGFTPRKVLLLFLAEGAGLAMLGSVAGSFGAVLYAKGMLRGLSTIWREAIASASLQFHAAPGTIPLGIVLSTVMAVFSIGLILRQISRTPARELLAGGFSLPAIRKPRGAGVMAVLFLAGALAVTAFGLWRGDTANAGAFFGAAGLMLLAGLSAASWALTRVLSPGKIQGREAGRPRGIGQAGHDGTSLHPGASDVADPQVTARVPGSLLELAIRGAARRHGRSLAVISLLACGIFLVAAIGVFRLDARRHAEARASGTGGFGLIGETSLPILKDLNSPEGREFYALPEAELRQVSIVSLRIRDGDEASCLNLNRAQQPRLAGVNPQDLQARHAFTFAAFAPGCDPRQGWNLLRRAGAPQVAADEIPAMGDAASLQWAMGKKKPGDHLEIVDERGRKIKLRLVASLASSILQGTILVDEAEFLKLYPNETGYRMFLADAPWADLAQVQGALTRALQNQGAQWVDTRVRLAQFNAVQNTYLNTFQILGGLGLLLGSAGLGVVLLRNVLERRHELALMLALGFEKRAVVRLVGVEHALLLAVGLLVGITSAAVAVLPAALSPDSAVPVRPLILTLLSIAASGGLFTWLAARFALRGNWWPALRQE